MGSWMEPLLQSWMSSQIHTQRGAAEQNPSSGCKINQSYSSNSLQMLSLLTQPSNSPLTMIMGLPKDIPLSSLTGVISEVLREEPTFPKGEDRPRAIITSVLLYNIQNGC